MRLVKSEASELTRAKEKRRVYKQERIENNKEVLMDGMVGRRNVVYKTKWEGVGGTCKPASTKVPSKTAGAVRAIAVPFVPTISGWCGTGKVVGMGAVLCKLQYELSVPYLPALQDGGSVGKLKETKPTSGTRYMQGRMGRS